MKAFTALILMLIILSSLYSQDSFKLGFTGSYPQYYDLNTYQVNWDNYRDLNMNTWQGWWVSDTAEFVFNKLSDNSLKGWFQPDTLRWAGYGRVQVIKAANTTGKFQYQGRWCGTPLPDNTQFGYGQTVMYYDKNSNCPNQNPGGMILFDIDENGMQSFSGILDPKYQAQFPGDGSTGNGYINTYYVKPRMRIDPIVALGPQRDVAKIIVKKFNGDIAADFIITTAEFRHDNPSTYDGRYLEEYWDLPISIPADILNEGRPGLNPYQYLDSCHVDYQVYWYGTVNVWIDYVKIMDEAAYRLFNDDPLVGGLLKSRLRDKILRLKAYENNYGEFVNGFYMEEINYCNIPCLKYLNELLQVWSYNDTD